MLLQLTILCLPVPKSSKRTRKDITTSLLLSNAFLTLLRSKPQFLARTFNSIASSKSEPSDGDEENTPPSSQ